MLKFLLVDDHSIVRTGVKFIISEMYIDALIDEASNGEETLEKVKNNSYDLILMDIEMPGTNTLKLIEVVLEMHKEAKILIFSMNAENIYGSRYIKAGTKGYLSKGTSVDTIKIAIDNVLNNKYHFSETIINDFIKEIKGEFKVTPFEKLSAREFTILEYLLKGKTTTEVAAILSLQISTVGTYKARLFEKLHVKNIVELVNLADAYGLKY